MGVYIDGDEGWEEGREREPRPLSNIHTHLNTPTQIAPPFYTQLTLALTLSLYLSPFHSSTLQSIITHTHIYTHTNISIYVSFPKCSIFSPLYLYHYLTLMCCHECFIGIYTLKVYLHKFNNLCNCIKSITVLILT